MLLKFGLFRAALFTGCWWRNVDVSTLRNICINRKQPNFNCRTFSLIDIIETLRNYFACELTEVFNFLNGSYTVDADIFFEYDKVIEEAILRNCLKDEVDLTSEVCDLEIGYWQVE